MTIIAGAISLHRQAISSELTAALKLHLRSNPDNSGKLEETVWPGFFMTKWDSGAFAEDAWSVASDGLVSTLVGDPLLAPAGLLPNRSEQLQMLIDPDGIVSNRALSITRGAFSIAVYSQSHHQLTLATDKIGLRPLYYTLQDGVLIFASALRIFESIDLILKKQSVMGTLETCVFGFPLGERTPYDGICVLREAQKLTVFASGKIETTHYCDWAPGEGLGRDQIAVAKRLLQKFQEGLRLRLGNDRKSYAFLSGGMDSRAIVSSLISSGCDVEAINFSPDTSQDQVYARLFAEALKSRCKLHFLPRDENPNFSMLAFAAKSKLEASQGISVDRSAFLWSGDGGSVGLGHVYMDEVMLQLAQRADFKAALLHFLKFNGLVLPVNAMTNQGGISTQEMLVANALSEINRYPRADGGRRIYFFLLFNDQRRHLFKHFETIDQHGLEFLLPFYDVDFLKMVADTPSEWGILHRLYSTWFDELAPSARSTPWQTYPGHVPCPVEGDDTLSYQWSGRTSKAVLGFSDRLTCARRLVHESLSATLPPMFSRVRVFLAGALHAVGLRDCRHILTMLTTYRQLARYVNKK